MLKRYRLLHDINLSQQIENLKKNGWNIQQFENGSLEDPDELEL